MNSRLWSTFKCVLALKYVSALLLLGLVMAACSSRPTGPLTQATAGTETLMLPGHSKPTTVTYDIVDGVAIFEGDIILGKVDADGKLIRDRILDSQGVAIEGNDYRWPLGVVPYRINNAMPRAGVQHILEAIAHWEANTRIRFAPHSGQADYVEFMIGFTADSCSSAVGRQGGKQGIRLSSLGDCPTGTIIHEIGHAVGLWHEQARADRDSYVQILYENIMPGRQHNFEPHVADGFDIGFYDYDSIMHYPRWAFAIDSNACLNSNLSKCTILPKHGVSSNRIGQRNGLSRTDILSVGYLYPSFDSLGGGLIGAPAVVSWGGWNSAYRAVFVRGTDNALWYRERLTASSFSWTPWKSLGGYLTSDPAAVSWSLNRIDVFARGANNQLIHKWLSGDFELEWSGWESLGGILNGAPAVSSRDHKKLDVFIRGNDNRLYHKYFDGNGWISPGWSGWQNQGGQISSAPASVSWNSNRIDIFARGVNNTLQHRWWDGSWHSWESLGGGLLSGPTVASWGLNRLDVFMRGAGDRIYHKIYNGQWTGWEYIEGYTFDDPEAIAVGPNKLDVFVRGLDGALWHKYWDGN